MNCPVCNLPLQMTERTGVEIDYCQKCRGVWLDRGELDKIIERSEGPAVQQAPAQTQQSWHGESQSHKPHHDTYHKPKKRRESFLGELFDF